MSGQKSAALALREVRAAVSEEAKRSGKEGEKFADDADGATDPYVLGSLDGEFIGLVRALKVIDRAIKEVDGD